MALVLLVLYALALLLVLVGLIAETGLIVIGLVLGVAISGLALPILGVVGPGRFARPRERVPGEF
jgi:hypothetical protein